MSLKVTLSEPESWKRVLDVEVSAEVVSAAIEERMKDVRRKASIPGFRPGKIPAAIVKQRFGEAIRADAIEELIQKYYQEACREKGVSPVAPGKVNAVKSDEGGPLTFTIEAEVEPAVEIKGYQKLKIKSQPEKIRSGDVDKSIESLRQRFATFNDVARPAKKGDYVMFKYQKVTIDGAERADISSPTYPVEVGTSTIKGFDKAVVGASAGQTVDADIQFPRDYPDTDIANKKGEFSLLIDKVQEQVLPELNEEFLKKLGDFKDEAALRERITKDMEEREIQRAKSDAANKAIESLIKTNPFDVPPSMVERYIDAVLEDMKERAQPGQPIPSRDEVAEKYREVGIHAMKRARIINYIAAKENIKAAQEDVDKQIQDLATQFGQPFDKLKEELRARGTTQRIRDDIRERKTLEYLIGEYDPTAPVPAQEPAKA